MIIIGFWFFFLFISVMNCVFIDSVYRTWHVHWFRERWQRRRWRPFQLLGMLLRGQMRERKTRGEHPTKDRAVAPLHTCQNHPSPSTSFLVVIWSRGMAATASLKSSLLLPSPISDFSGAAVSILAQVTAKTGSIPSICFISDQQRQTAWHCRTTSSSSSEPALDGMLNFIENQSAWNLIWQKRRSWQPRGARMQVSAAANSKNILMMGGTRFIGVFLSRLLVKEGHQVSQ